MNLEKKQRIKECVAEIAAILYEEAPKEELTSLAAIEKVVREQTQEYVTPELGFFLFQELQEPKQDIQEKSKVS
jgi:hypothetical protein